MKKTKQMKSIFKADHENWEGVPRINIYLLRLLYILMFFVLGKDVWTYILTYQGEWQPTEAVSWSVWASFSVLAFLGIVHPLKMLPILFLEIFYKILWLILVAYPLWMRNELIGSDAEDITFAFLWVALPVVAVPWKYAFREYILFSKKK